MIPLDKRPAEEVSRLISNPQAIREELERRRVGRVSSFQQDPYGFTMWDLPWGTGTLQRFEGPDTWQKEFLIDLGEQVRSRNFDGFTPVDPIRMTVSAGKGIGKGVLSALICNWIVKTWPYCQGTITANTFSQLENKTWATIQHWFRLSKSSGDFIIGASGIYHKAHGKAWQCHPETCREENSEAFAGQHAANSVGFHLMDESSAIPEKIWEVAESGMVDGMPMIFAFGNPTRSNGKFFKINFGDDRKRWNSRAIDSRDCMIPNKKTLQESVEEYGEDSDYVRVYVKGLPPNASDMQYIDSRRVWAAQARPMIRVLPDEPLIAGVDLARGGVDNAVIRFRRGADARSIPPIRIKGEEVRDSMRLVAKLADLTTQKFGGMYVTAWFLDGGGVGGPIIDRMVQLGHKNFIEIQFGGECPDSQHYGNMRSWMWSKMRDWLGDRGLIDPKDRRLEIDLTGVGLGRADKKDRIFLETKEDMRKRGLDSPDDGDGLCLTFAEPVAPLVLSADPAPRPYYNRGGGGSMGWAR